MSCHEFACDIARKAVLKFYIINCVYVARRKQVSARVLAPYSLMGDDAWPEKSVDRKLHNPGEAGRYCLIYQKICFYIICKSL